MKRYRREILTGIISPSSWDDNDEIDGYSLFTEDDEDILLEGRRLNGDFGMFKNKKIKVEGNFLASSNEPRVFIVKKTMPFREVA